MKKFRIIVVLSLFSLFFLLVQIYVVKYVAKPRKEIDSVEDEKKPRQSKDQSYANIKTFTELCEHLSVPVFLIDPPILSAVMSNRTHWDKVSCKYLCVSDDNTALGIVSSQWKPKDDVLGEMRKEGFAVVTVTDAHPQQMHVDSLLVPEVPTHYIFQRGGHALHLVVFYERDGDFWWQGPLLGKTRSGDIEQVSINTNRLKFGRHVGAYDKMDLVKVEMDRLHIYAPRFPTLFLKQLPHARFLECNHTRAKLFHAKHGQDASPRALVFRKAARNVLARAKKTLDELGIRFWMSSGTCLGWFRQCDIIPYSRDVDIGIWIKDYDVRLMPAMQMGGLPLKELFGKPSDSYQLSFMGGEVKLDIFFFYEESDHMWNGGTQARTGKKFKYYFPKFTLCWTEFLDMKLRIPCQTEAYIEANYGKNWFEPVKHWDWKRSPPNVRENGEWPKDKWNDVIQEFE